MAERGTIATVRTLAKDLLVEKHRDEYEQIVTDEMAKRGYVPSTKTVWVDGKKVSPPEIV